MVFSPQGAQASTLNGSSSMHPSTEGGAGGKESGEGSFPPEKAEVERAAQALCRKPGMCGGRRQAHARTQGPQCHVMSSLPCPGWGASLSGTESLIPSASVQGPVKTMIISLGRLT